MEKDPEAKANLKKVLIDEHIPFYFGRFDKQLEENNGYFVKKVSANNSIYKVIG